MDVNKPLIFCFLIGCLVGRVHCSQGGDLPVDLANILPRQNIQPIGQDVKLTIRQDVQHAKERAPLYKKVANVFKGGLNFCKKYPATIGLVAANLGVFALQKSLSPNANNDFARCFVRSNDMIKKWQLWRFFTSMFLHANFDHLCKNIFNLISAGYLEDRVGSSKFLGYYVASGALGGVTSFLIDACCKCNRSYVGASGAITGIMGAAAAQLPATVNTLCKKTDRTSVGCKIGAEWGMKIGVVGAGLFSLGLDFYSIIREYRSGILDGVGHAAHIGGFVSGFVLDRVFSD